MRKAVWPADFQRVSTYFRSDLLQPIKYTDGDSVERRLADELRGVGDRSLLSTQLPALITDWPSLYHFSPLRANLLRPINFKPGARVLEVGAGCGAISRYLGELGLEVTAVEGTEQRAEIAGIRTEDLPNVTVLAGNVDEIDVGADYDYVVVIGVLEYAALFYQGADAHTDMLRRLRRVLKPDGLLVLAIENRLGTKYIGGMPEDHTGIPFQGPNDGYRAGGPRTFAKTELLSLFSAAGFNAQRLLCPFPDYKLPVAVADIANTPVQYRESVAQLAAMAFVNDRQVRTVPTLSLEMLMAGSVRDGIGENLANSFLVIAGEDPRTIDEATDQGAFAWSYAVGRAAGFQKTTTLRSAGGAGIAGQERMGASDATATEVTQELATSQLLDGRSCWLEFAQAVNVTKWTFDSAALALLPWFQQVRNCYEQGDDQSVLVDATPFNAFLTDRGVEFFDLEWRYGRRAPLEWIVLRGVDGALERLTSVAESPYIAAETPRVAVALSIVDRLYEMCGLDASLDFQSYAGWYSDFLSECTGSPRVSPNAASESLLRRRLRQRTRD